jgi:hypothetical protein|tara:strand:+ start:11121 stop:11318 length:198 start_codon:yes stop_codon:yes gene_type:complete
MALEDLQSQYGPLNNKGQKGTGKVVDTLAFEGDSNLGHKNANSKYKTTENNGTPEKSGDGLAKGK